LRRRLEISDQVLSLLLLLEAGENHFGAGNVFLRIRQINVEGVRAPRDAFLDVGLRVGEARGLSCLPAPESPEVGSGLVLAALLDGVALSASLHEDLLSLGRVSTHD